LSDAERDPLTGRDVRIVGHRQDRPNLPDHACPFCPGGLEAPANYDTHWFVNRWPPLPMDRAEVLLYTPQHDASMATLSPAQARAVVDLWAYRTIELGGRDDVAYVLVFENRGEAVGATIAHPHGQIYAYDFVPPAAQRELDHGGECVLCQAVPDGLLVDSLGGWQCSVPALSTWPYELLLAPRDHIADLPLLDGPSRDATATLLPRAIAALDTHFGSPTPLMMWIHQRPFDGGVWPQAHVHIHVTPIWRSPGVPRFVAAAELGSEVFFNPVAPDEAAASLRSALSQ
jgi:UDPglucose--hexose-1-phosphate uridylyltransferase